VAADNPFGDVEREAVLLIERQLSVANELDQMDADVSSWQADFLENVIRQLRDHKRPLSQKQIDVLHQMCGQYDVECDL
jgi:hypothetical protein